MSAKADRVVDRLFWWTVYAVIAAVTLAVAALAWGWVHGY